MRNFQDTFETWKWSFISAFSICMTVPLILTQIRKNLNFHLEKYEIGQVLFYNKTLLSRSILKEVFCKKNVFRNSQNSQENTCVRIFLKIKLQTEACNFIKKKLLHRCFSVNFAKFLRTPFLTEHLWWLLLTFRKQQRHIHSPAQHLTRSVLRKQLTAFSR